MKAQTEQVESVRKQDRKQFKLEDFESLVNYIKRFSACTFIFGDNTIVRVKSIKIENAAIEFRLFVARPDGEIFRKVYIDYFTAYEPEIFVNEKQMLNELKTQIKNTVGVLTTAQCIPLTCISKRKAKAIMRKRISTKMFGE